MMSAAIPRSPPSFEDLDPRWLRTSPRPTARRGGGLHRLRDLPAFTRQRHRLVGDAQFRRARAQRRVEEMTRLGQVDQTELQSVLEDHSTNIETVAVEPISWRCSKAFGSDSEALWSASASAASPASPSAPYAVSTSARSRPCSAASIRGSCLGHRLPRAAMGFELLRNMEDTLGDVVRRIALTEEMPFEWCARSTPSSRPAPARSPAGLLHGPQPLPDHRPDAQLRRTRHLQVIMEKLGKDLPDAATEIQA